MYPFEIDPRVENINVPPSEFVPSLYRKILTYILIANRAIYVLPLSIKNDTDPPPQQLEAPSTMIAASTFPIQDDIQSRRYSVINFSPPISPDTCQFKTDCSESDFGLRMKTY